MEDLVSQRLETAAKAAFERHVANQIAAGKYIVGDWDALKPEERAAWRSVVSAALAAWEDGAALAA